MSAKIYNGFKFRNPDILVIKDNVEVVLREEKREMSGFIF